MYFGYSDLTPKILRNFECSDKEDKKIEKKQVQQIDINIPVPPPLPKKSQIPCVYKTTKTFMCKDID